jgi:hypothetical protein
MGFYTDRYKPDVRLLAPAYRRVVLTNNQYGDAGPHHWVDILSIVQLTPRWSAARISALAANCLTRAGTPIISASHDLVGHACDIALALEDCFGRSYPRSLILEKIVLNTAIPFVWDSTLQAQESYKLRQLRVAQRLGVAGPSVDIKSNNIEVWTRIADILSEHTGLY